MPDPDFITEQEFDQGPSDLDVVADVLAELLHRDDTLPLAEAVLEVLHNNHLHHPKGN
jgi:hypothetical protein